MKKILFCGIVILLFASICMYIQVKRVPNYQGGESYVSYSPDGRFRLDLVFPKKGYRTVRLLTSLKSGKVKSIARTSSIFHDYSLDFNPSFICKDDDSYCYEHTLQTDTDSMSLSPSWWDQLHAWLVIKYNDIEDPQLEICEIDKFYPPVKKNKQ